MHTVPTPVPLTTPGPAPDPAKVERLHALVDQMGSVLVAFSGGVDSALVLKVCWDRLGDQAQAVIGVSASLPPGELEEARRLSAWMGATLEELPTAELERPDYVANPADRCYFCKQELYGRVLPLARDRGIPWVVDGTNLDDPVDERPGMRAATEAGVRHPLREAGFTKADVRQHARALGLDVWDKPALACLSSRIPQGQPITPLLLDQVGQAESVLHRHGFPICRVRAHGDVARIEVPADRLEDLLAQREAIVHGVRATGFAFVSLDLVGYSSGSLSRAGRAP